MNTKVLTYMIILKIIVHSETSAEQTVLVRSDQGINLLAQKIRATFAQAMVLAYCTILSAIRTYTLSKTTYFQLQVAYHDVCSRTYRNWRGHTFPNSSGPTGNG